MGYAERAAQYLARTIAPPNGTATNREISEISDKSSGRTALEECAKCEISDKSEISPGEEDALALPIDCFARLVCPVLGPCDRHVAGWPCQTKEGEGRR